MLSDDYRVTQKLCQALFVLESSNLSEACIHSLFAAQSLKSDNEFGLAPIIAKSKKLRKDLTERLGKEEDDTLFFYYFSQFYLVNIDDLKDCLKDVLKMNKKIRPAMIEYYSGSTQKEVLKMLKIQ